MPPGDPANPPPAGRPWSSRSLGSRWQHGVFYALIRLGGRRAAYALLYLVVGWYVACRPAVRTRLRPYLARRFPARSGWRARWADSYRWTLSLGQVLVDRAVVGVCGPAALTVTFPDGDELLRVLAEGKGLVLMNSHVGCWQVAMSALGHLPKPVTMLLQRETGDVDRHYFEHAGQAAPFHHLDPHGYLGGVLEMLGVLKRGEILAVMGDRVLGAGGGTVSVPFLGGAVSFPFSAYKLASATGAPIAVLFSCKTGPAAYELRLARVIRVPAGLGRTPESFQPWVAEYVAALTAYVEANPFQFFNFYDMWQPETAAGNRSAGAPGLPGDAGRVGAVR